MCLHLQSDFVRLATSSDICGRVFSIHKGDLTRSCILQFGFQLRLCNLMDPAWNNRYMLPLHVEFGYVKYAALLLTLCRVWVTGRRYLEFLETGVTTFG